MYIFLFFFNDTATTEIYTLSLHDALPIYIPPLGYFAQYPRYFVSLGDVVHVGVVARLADGVHDQLPVHAGLGHLACAVDFGDEDRVGGGEGLAELPVELAGARVTVRLEDRDDPAFEGGGRAGGFEGGGELRGVVGVVVHHPHFG